MSQLVFSLFTFALSVAVALASVPDSLQINCDVDRTAFRKLAASEATVTFRLWDSANGGSQCGSDHVVSMVDVLALRPKGDKFDGQRPRKFLELRVVLGTDGASGTPVQLCAGEESWLDVQVGATTLTCEFSADPNSKQGVAPDALPRRRLPGVAYSQRCTTCSTASDVSARVYRGSNSTIPRGVGIVVAFDHERWDTGNIHDPSDDTKLVAPVAGKYLIFAHVRWAVPSDPTPSVRELGIRLNGGGFIASDRRSDAIGDQVNQSISTHHELAVGEYVELEVHHTALPSTLDVVADGGLSPEFGMVKLP